MNKFKTSVSNTLEKIQFKNIKVITVSAIAVSLFLMFLTITMPLSDGYSSGMAIKSCCSITQRHWDSWPPEEKNSIRGQR